MQRRFQWLAVFLLPWLVVLIVPQLRTLLRVQTLGSTIGLVPYPWTERFQGDAFDAKVIAEAHPGSLPALVGAAEATNDYGEASLFPATVKLHHRERTQSYDRLIARFPDQTWLLARRLVATSGWLRDNRLGGDLENSARKPWMAPSPEISKDPVSFTDKDLKDAVAVAQRGRRAEPDNSFYDWTLFGLLYAAHRDAEAYKVLHEGSLKPRYDDHSADTTESAIAAHELVRPLLVEEKMGLGYTIAFPQFAHMRHLARLISWDAIKAEMAGDHQHALQIRSDLARLAEPMMRPPNTLIAGLVAEAVQAIAWSGPGRKLSRQQLQHYSQSGNQAARARAQAALFAAYATAHGRGDLADEATRLGEDTGRFANLTTSWLRSHGVSGMPARLFTSIIARFLLAVGALVQVAFGLVVWLGLGVLLWRVRAEPVRRRDLMLSLGLTAVVAAVAALGVLVMRLTLPGWGDLLDSGADFGSPALALACLAAFVLVPLLGTPLLIVAVTAWRRWRAREALRAQFVREADDCEGLSRRNIPPSVWPVVTAFCTWATVLMTVACWSTTVFAAANHATNWSVPWPGDSGLMLDDPAVWFGGAAAILTVFCYFGWLLKWRFLTPPPLRPQAHHALAWYRQTVGGWLIIASLAYLLFNLASLPLRRQADADVTRYRQQGEIAIAMARLNKS